MVPPSLNRPVLGSIFSSSEVQLRFWLTVGAVSEKGLVLSAWGTSSAQVNAPIRSGFWPKRLSVGFILTLSARESSS